MHIMHHAGFMPRQYLCVHGHFYQPPRENPLTGEVPIEPGAAPFRNWNERILSECYRPNAELGNYERISFNFGPTLLTWLETHDPATYQSILTQDQANERRFGVGNAMAQAYNHTILPLANTADKVIQIAWGIADFQHRFRRYPQGMWLPETAVDYETLSIMANLGIQFTILAPWQAEGEGFDPRQPYRVELPGGKQMVVFFYHGDLSGKISFDPGATANADHFIQEAIAHYLKDGDREKPQLLLLASDGELYGHHQPSRERFLAHLLDGASAQHGFETIYPGLWLREHPPRETIRIRERTSWSCHHGIMRWMGTCDCTPLGSVEGVQADGYEVGRDSRSSRGNNWKAHLRRALDRLAAALDGVYFEAVYPLIPRPRVLLQRYIHVILGEISAEGLITEMLPASGALARAPGTEELERVRLLLAAQRERQRMFTSCGWFFEDFDRLEPRNVLAYAANAVRLVRQATGDDLAAEVLVDLRHVVSPRSGVRGDEVFLSYLERSKTPHLSRTASSSFSTW